MKSKFIRLGLLALFIAALTGCSGGDDGAPGATGATGPQGPTGATGAAGASAGNNAAAMTPSKWADSQFNGTITGVTIGSDGKPVVSFKVTDAAGNPVTGLGNTTKNPATAVQPNLVNIFFTMDKLVPGTNGSPSRWVSYIVTSNPTIAAPTSIPARPTTETFGTLVDNGDGTYKYTFFRAITGGTGSVQDIVNNYAYTGLNIKADLDDLTYDANLTHRVGISINGNARGTGTNTADGSTAATAAVALKTPVNFFYDFIPATGKVATDAQSRNIVNISNCFSCHSKFAGNAHGGNALTGVGGTRQDTKMCVMCHTKQTVYGRGEAVATATGWNMASNNTKLAGQAPYYFPRWIHMLHMGEEKIKIYDNPPTAALNETRFPQDLRNCTKCHSNAAQADNWKTVPNRAACGACHDGIDFATGKGKTLNGVFDAIGHVGGPRTDDSACASCHTPDAINLVHTPVTLNVSPLTGIAAPSPYFVAYADKLPAGTKRITYDLKSVTLNASRNPVFTFRFMDSTTSPANPVVFNAAPAAADANIELMPNFVGTGPSTYIVGSIPQDGITPADYNFSASAAPRNCWNKSTATTCTMVAGTGADAGYYVLTIINTVVPANAKMVTGWLGLGSTLIQTNVAGYAYTPAVTGGAAAQGGITFPAIAVSKPVSTADVRRAIVERARCENCHNQLGIFTKSVFHNGQRNDPTACNVCHNNARTSGGWSVNSNAYIHGIHGAAKRTVPFTWVTSAYGRNDYWSTLGYPGILRNCQQCHLPNTVNFGVTANAAAANGLLPFMTAATGRFATSAGATTTTYTGTTGTCVAGTSTAATDLTAGVISPYVRAYGNNVSFGTGFVSNITTAATPATGKSCTADGVAYTLAPGATREADGNTLVNSPIANACFSCHTTDAAAAHMKANGGSLYATRTSLRTDPANPTKLINNEQCLVCHGAGRVADAEVIHAQTMKPVN